MAGGAGSEVEAVAEGLTLSRGCVDPELAGRTGA
jgi:hypothetical protein